MPGHLQLAYALFDSGGIAMRKPPNTVFASTVLATAGGGMRTSLRILVPLLLVSCHPDTAGTAITTPVRLIFVVASVPASAAIVQ